MGNKLAIHGHPRRGKEVIGLLEMMGGNNIHDLSGDGSYAYYVIEGCQNEIRAGEYIFGDEDMCFLTLEDFWEKYPFKIGDKVVDRYGDSLTIKSMSWSEDCETMVYDFEDSVLVLAAVDLKMANDMTNETITPAPDITANVIDKNNCGIQCPDGYEFYDENGNLIGTKVMMRPKKPKYPKLTNLSECKEILGEKDMYQGVSGYKGELLTVFQRLLILRDAYWKIAGEEMRLGKPWKPDWNDLNRKYFISLTCDGIGLYDDFRNPQVLAFPTEEMRDVFYENFRDLIEQCKELL